MPRLADAGDEGRIVAAIEPRDVSKGCHQHLGHFRSAVVARCEIELPDPVPLNCRFLQLVESDSLVFGEKYPSLFADEGEPNCIFSTWRKMGAMPLMLDAVLGERIENGLAVVKIFVEIKNEVFRQRQLPSAAPTGLLLRSDVA